MSALAPFLAAAGSFRATHALRDPGSALACDSESLATVTPRIDGRFVRIDYTWAFKGAPQDGSLPVGVEQAAGAATVARIAGGHNGDRLMPCTSTSDAGLVDMRGAYPAPESPDWSWRTRLGAAGDTLSMTMFDVTPDEEEFLAVDARYRRA